MDNHTANDVRHKAALITLHICFSRKSSSNVQRYGVIEEFILRYQSRRFAREIKMIGQ